LAFDGGFQRIVKLLYVGRIIFHVGVIHPVTGVPSREFPVFAIEIMTGEEWFVMSGEAFKPF